MTPSPERMAKGMWWDRAWSLVSGCTPVSEACDHCWAAREAHMRANHPNAIIAARNKGLTRLDYPVERGNPNIVFNGTVRENCDLLNLPIRTRKPTVWAIWNDLFHENVGWNFIFSVFKTMAFSPQHTFLILTKRPERMRSVLDEVAFHISRNFPDKLWPLSNVWLGTTVENQEQADARIHALLTTPAAVRFLSVEPMLGPVDIKPWITKMALSMGSDGRTVYPRSPAAHGTDFNHPVMLDLVLCGGESGPGARPMHPDWVRSLRDQCVSAGVPFLFKQWGEWIPVEPLADEFPSCGDIPEGEYEQHDWDDYRYSLRVGKKRAGRLLDGREWNEWPEKTK